MDFYEMDKKRMRHKFVSGHIGKGYAMIGISKETMVRATKNGIYFVKSDKDITLTKEELLNEFKICLETGYITKEELFGE